MYWRSEFLSLDVVFLDTVPEMCYCTSKTYRSVQETNPTVHKTKRTVYKANRTVLKTFTKRIVRCKKRARYFLQDPPQNGQNKANRTVQ